MKELLISSGVLILALAALRATVGRRISARVRYALWGLVLLRLALPFGLPQSRASVMNYLPQQPAAVVRQIAPGGAVPEPGADMPAQPLPAEEVSVRSVPQGDPSHWLWLVWGMGAAAAGGWMLVQNLRFARRLYRTRVRVEQPDCPLPVYECPGLPSPCLFGVLRPAIYLNEAAREPQTRAWVLLHERQHYRHGDHVWCLLRCLCLAAYWFNPLVWLAAELSRRDCELACDEGVTVKLPPRRRLEYGQCLLALTPTKNAGQRLVAATGMSENARELQGRLAAVVRKHKTAVWAAALTAVLAAAVVAVTFTGATAAKADNEPPGSSQAAGGMLLTGADAKDPQKVLAVLKEGISVDEDGQLGFTLPQSDFSAEEWSIFVYGTIRMDEGSSMALHYLEAEQAEHRWKGGERYTIGPAEKLWLYELWLDAELPYGDSIRGLRVDLLPYVAEATDLKNAQRRALLAALLPENETEYVSYPLEDGYTVVCANLTGTDPAAADEIGFTGGFYLLTADGRLETLHETEYQGDVTDGSISAYSYCAPCAPMDAGNGRILFGFTMAVGTWGDTRLWTLENGRAVEVEVPGENLEFLGEGRFTVVKSAWDSDAILVDGEWQFTGHTWKQYWLYWDEESFSFREYGGVAITEKQLMALDGAGPDVQTQLEAIRLEGGQIDSIYLRGNGIVNINYSIRREETALYQNITLQPDSDGKLCALTYQPYSSNWLETLDQGGVYAAAAFPEIANFPAAP